MKTLGKLKINSERLLKDEELRTLKGGVNCCCIITYTNGTTVPAICGTANNYNECGEMCWSMGYGFSWGEF